jgi:uncharacterized protein (TIGR02145 family)
MKNLLILVTVLLIGCTKNSTNNDTPPTIPSVMIGGMFGLADTSVGFSVYIQSDGGSNIISSGVCWSVNSNPTLANNKTSDYTGSTLVESSINGLTPNTTYHVRAYATNAVGTAYSEQWDVTTTQSNLPTVLISNINSITSTDAIANGNVTNQGGSTVTESGFQISTLPSLASGNGFIAGSGIGSFTRTISSLLPNTTYYIRAYAINSYGIAYSSIISFTTSIAPTTVTDIDGNIYHTVTIGSQVWMVENLKVSKYRDGTTIPNITDNIQWTNLTTGAYCHYKNDASYNTTLGKLYNWYAVNTGKLAPTGWHVPTQAEIQTLANYLGGTWNSSVNNYTVVGGKMKSTSSLWNAPNTGATNSSGFTGLPSNVRNNGTFNPSGYDGNYWTSTAHNATYSYFFGLSSGADGLSLYYWPKETGYAVRCIKN